MKEIFKKYFSQITDKKNRKNSIIAFSAIIVVLAAGYFSFGYYNSHRTIELGIITDIHAGNQDTRSEGIEPNNILHPANFEKNVSQALKNMRDCNEIITLGDNMNTPSTKYTEQLKALTKGYPMIWIKGNHDRKDIFEKVLYPKNYYYLEKGNWRIIVLDNSEIDPGVQYSDTDYVPRGYIDSEQMGWLARALKTNKKVLVAMHVPMIDRFHLDSIRDDQKDLENLLESRGNVKYVLAGHFHVDNLHLTKNGIEYYVLPSISLEGGEGYYMKLELKP
jgi:3',5'-cyclic AMP phosphodiesterase CpdA